MGISWRDDITSANEAVCETLAEAADELDKRIASRTRCTCKGIGFCIHCLLDELGIKDAVRAA